MHFDQRDDISKLNGSSVKLVDKSTYLGSSVSSTQKDINTWLTKAWTAIDRLLGICKSNLTDKIKRSFFPSSGRVDSAIWIHYIDPNSTYGEKAWWQLHKNDGSNMEQHPTKQQLYGHLPPISKTFKVRRTRYAGHSWRSKDELISHILL